MNNEASGNPRLLRGLLIVMAGQCLSGCAVDAGKETTENHASVTRVESTTPVKQWPMKDPYIVNHGGKVQVIPDERYEPRPSKK